jgi:hypothetical protein
MLARHSAIHLACSSFRCASMIGASRSALFARERSVASSWQSRHHELKPSRQRRLPGKSLAGFCWPQWRPVFIRSAALLIFGLGPQNFESVFSRKRGRACDRCLIKKRTPFDLGEIWLGGGMSVVPSKNGPVANSSNTTILFPMTGDAQGLEVGHVVGIDDELQLDLVMNLERLGHTAVDAGITVASLHRLPRSLPRHPVPDPPSRVGGVALPFTLPTAVGTAPLLQVAGLEATLAASAEPQHRAFPLSLPAGRGIGCPHRTQAGMPGPAGTRRPQLGQVTDESFTPILSARRR